MRLLITTDTVGGVWTFTRQLTTELLQRGHSVALVSIGRSPSQLQQAWCDTTAHTHPTAFSFSSCSAPLEWMQHNADSYSSAAPLLLSIVREFSPDALISNQYCFGALPICIPKIVVAHSDVLSWAKACRNVPLPASAWLDQYIRLVSSGLDQATAVVAPTLWMLAALAENFTLPCHAVAIDNGRSLPEAPAAISRKHQAVAAGRFWDEAKNLQLLQRLTHPLPILVAGDVGMSTDAAPPHSANLKFLGELDEDELLSLFRESSIYLCTSVYEPFGLAPLEAALCGCAVVAHDIPSLREVWGDCALFFRDAAELSAILDSLRNPANLHAAQQRTQLRARLFTASRMAERYINLVQSLLQCEVHGTGSTAHAA